MKRPAAGIPFGSIIIRPVLLGALSLAFAALPAVAQNTKSNGDTHRMEIYGYVMLDMIEDFGQVDPFWFDVLRPTKLPAFDDEFGENLHNWFSVRQTRTGIKTYFPTPFGRLFTLFEWELFGVGVDAGQTTIRLRHAYAELGHFGVGQYWSPFMDIDVFPNQLEYWGPNGMVFFRNVQFRYMPVQGDSRITFAIERPGASGDLGRFEERIELQNIRARFSWPDFSAEARKAGKRGYIEIAGLVRHMKWDDILEDDLFDLSGRAWGWGLNVSTNIKFGKKAVFKGQFTGGRGAENYMNDAPFDVGPVLNLDNIRRPIVGRPLGFTGMTAFLDVYWSDLFTSTIGYSNLNMDNVDGQEPFAFNTGQYALANLLSYPTKNTMVGGEIQWGRRTNAFDDFDFSDVRLQFSARANYSLKFWEEDKDRKRD